MFKKLISRLPFNPSLISNLRDYDLKLKKELRLRVIGILVLVMVLVLQVIVVIFPPANATISSPDNLMSVSGGTFNQLFKDCSDNLDQYQSILASYELACSDLYAGKIVDLNLDTMGNSLFSLNRLSYDTSDETAVVVNGHQLYVRKLSFGNQLESAYLKVLKIELSSQTIYVALNSGNIISTKEFLINGHAVPECSILQLSLCFKYSISVRDVTSRISDVNNATVSAGNILAYTLSATNTLDKNVSNFRLSVDFNNALAYSNLVSSYGGQVKNGIVSYTISSIGPGQTQTEEITTKIKSPIASNSISQTDNNYFDQKMVTSFGNTVVVSVPKSFNKFYEININNGFYSSSFVISVVFLLLLIIALVYFTLRAILIRQEIKIIRHGYTHPQKGSDK